MAMYNEINRRAPEVSSCGGGGGVLPICTRVRVCVCAQVVEATNADVVDENCKNSLCLFAFLPHILDSGAAGRNEFLDVLRAVSEKLKNRPLRYVWAEALKQPRLEQALGAGGAGEYAHWCGVTV